MLMFGLELDSVVCFVLFCFDFFIFFKFILSNSLFIQNEFRININHIHCTTLGASLLFFVEGVISPTYCPMLYVIAVIVLFFIK